MLSSMKTLAQVMLCLQETKLILDFYIICYSWVIFLPQGEDDVAFDASVIDSHNEICTNILIQ